MIEPTNTRTLSHQLNALADDILKLKDAPKLSFSPLKGAVKSMENIGLRLNTKKGTAKCPNAAAFLKATSTLSVDDLTTSLVRLKSALSGAVTAFNGQKSNAKNQKDKMLKALEQGTEMLLKARNRSYASILRNDGCSSNHSNLIAKYVGSTQAKNLREATDELANKCDLIANQIASTIETDGFDGVKYAIACFMTALKKSELTPDDQKKAVKSIVHPAMIINLSSCSLKSIHGAHLPGISFDTEIVHRPVNILPGRHGQAIKTGGGSHTRFIPQTELAEAALAISQKLYSLPENIKSLGSDYQSALTDLRNNQGRLDVLNKADVVVREFKAAGGNITGFALDARSAKPTPT